ncbi:MAG TPA: phosphate acyltransferase PlsX [Planctomycetota bacterium]|nr:phosphate acyltransferase PlsX [Planctomycetota bacterium]
MRIAVDAMGGDEAPSVVVEGALLASRYLKPHKIILVGDEQRIKECFAAFGYAGTGLEIVHAPEVVFMGEHPAEAMRRKRHSSIRVASELVRDGRADALISAGNTGAAVAASCISFGLLPGIRKPGIAAPMPTRQGGVCVLIDAGANMAPTPTHLLQYAIMADIYCKIAFDIKSPRVGLLNVGEEDAKGNVLAKETYARLKESQLNFLGNVEGRDVFEGTCDLIVCDGFVGNSILKAAEGLSEAIIHLLRTELHRNLLRRLGGLLCKSAFRSVKDRMDCSEYGGAPLLGVNGISIISHGGSNGRAIFNAIRVAARLAEMDLNTKIVDEVGAAVRGNGN